MPEIPRLNGVIKALEQGKVAFCGFASPIGMISCCSRKRSSLGCTSSGRSPISSRNSVPPAAARTRPG